MKQRQRTFITATLLAFALSTLFAATPSAETLVTRMDAAQSLKTDATVTVEMAYSKRGQGTKKTVMRYFRRDKADTFLIIIQSPDHEKGNGYLRDKDDIWMYRQSTRSFQRIKRDAWVSDTDVKIGDMEKQKIGHLYQAIPGVKSVKLGKIPCYMFSVKAKPRKEVTYPKKTYWISQKTSLPQKIEAYSASGELMNITYYHKYMKIDGKYLFTKATFINKFMGNRTVVTLKDVKTGHIPSYVFTKAELENKSK